MQDVEKIGIKVEGVWLPKAERHLTEWMLNSKGAVRREGLITYQWSKQEAAMAYAKAYIPKWQDKQFVDVGAHVGLWSMWWGPMMNGVTAFEPIPDMRTLYQANMQGRGNYNLLGEALGDKEGLIELAFNPENTGNTHTSHEGDDDLAIIHAKVTTLDNRFGAKPATPEIGVIKIDTEGVEEMVVRGGERTIKYHKPLIIVEQKKGAAYYGNDPVGAVTLLESWGYRTLKVMSGDYIMCHRDFV